ncbi:MAG: LuxR C-terminal-related transcriptional regulator, partial [Anaerolineaceae bacterium]
IRASMESISGNHPKGYADGLRLVQNRSMESDYVYAMLTYAMAMALENQGLLQDAVGYFEKSRDLGLKYHHHYGVFHSTIALAGLYMRQARLKEARREFSLALSHALSLNLENAAISLAQTGLLHIALEKNDLSEADELARDTLQNFDKTIVSESVWIKHIERCVALADYFVIRGDTENARDYFDRALSSQYEITGGAANMPARMIEVYGRILLAEARNRGENAWQQEANQLLDPLSKASPAGQMLQARLYLNQGHGEAARDLMRILVKKMRQSENQDQMIRALVLFACSLYACHDESAALVVIEDALQQGSMAGYARVFTEEGERMFSMLRDYMETSGYEAFERDNPGYIAGLLAWFENERILQESPSLTEMPVTASLHLLQEPLSERELEVLKLLNSDKSTKEIADALMISFNTTKTHIMNIYRKFDVHSRRMLIDRINDLGK